MKHVKFSALVATTLFTVVAGSALALNPGQARSEPPLARLALQSHELPGGSVRKAAGSISADDMSQPLNETNSIVLSTEVSEFLFEYEEAYKVEGVIPNGESSAYFGNYLYRYADHARAEAVAEALIDSILQNQGILLSGGSRIADSALHGQAAMIIGAEGDAVYWFAGARDRTLILLMVNGMAVPSTQESFKSLMAHLLQR